MEIVLVLSYILMCITNLVIAESKHQNTLGVLVCSVLLSPLPAFLYVLAAPDYKQRQNEARIIELLEAMQPEAATGGASPAPTPPAPAQRKPARGNPLFGAK